MKISYNWLKRYTSLDEAPEALAEILTNTGLEVEGLEKVESVKGGLEGVVIGEVLTCVPHENADRLKVTTVNVGGENPLQIVCGAPNVTIGQKVAVAIVGCVLYPKPDEPFKIKKSKIRGVVSEGMICAEDELGIGVSHDGIMVLNDDAKVGVSGKEYFQLEDDFIFEIGLTPNRNDAMGHIGVLRDIIAYKTIHESSEAKINLPDISAFEKWGSASPNKKVNVSINDTGLVPRYIGVTIDNIQVKPSPDWLKNALLSIGLTPKNNVVDVTNFVMYEFGTPLHAFDLTSFENELVVRNARVEETIITLDDEKRKLTEHDIVIANNKESLCIAGVLGGQNSGVKETTTAVFLEAAYFEAVSVRKTAKHHGINTDASFRFERGVDPNILGFVAKRTALLIQEVAGGDVIDYTDHYPSKIVPKQVEFSFTRCNQIIGLSIEKEIVRSILKTLDITIVAEKGDIATLSIPTYRADVTREADVIEEVLRIYGFNKVSVPEKLNMNLVFDELKPKQKARQKTVNYLVNNGFYEVMNNSLTKSKYTDELGGDVLNSEHNVQLLNPLSLELDVMRQSLIFQFLETIAHNQNRQQHDIAIFEIGKVYKKVNDTYLENNRLVIAMTGQKFSEQWNASNDSISFYSVKGIIEGLFAKLGFNHLISEKPLKKSILGDGINIHLLKKNIGSLGIVKKSDTAFFGIKNDVFVADLDWDALMEHLSMNKMVFKPLPKTFEVRRDLSLLCDSNVKYDEIVEVVENTERKLLQRMQLFDVYEGKNLPKGKKSYAVSFVFQDVEHTLTDKKVDAIMSKIQHNLEAKLKTELRG